MFIRDSTLLLDNKKIVEEAFENVTLVYSLDEELFSFLSKLTNKYMFIPRKVK